jgi:hypothetical protein
MGLVSILKTAKSRTGAAWAAFDIRDFLVYGGLFSIGYGLYQFRPWLGWTAFGVVSMLLGLGWILRVRK